MPQPPRNAKPHCKAGHAAGTWLRDNMVMKQYPWMLRDVSAVAPEAPSASTAGPPETTGDLPVELESVAAFARATLAHHVGTLRVAHAEAVATGAVEPLHQLRVAVRRVRSDLRLFRAVLGGEAKGLRRDLGVVAAALGRVRDIDIHLDQLVDRSHPRQRGGLLEVSAALHHQRQAHWHTAVAALSTDRWATLLDALDTLTVLESETADEATLATAGPAALKACWSRFRRAAKRAKRDATPRALHRLRIANKLLRDALEVLADVCPAAVTAVREEVDGLHDTLGRLQDATVAARHFGSERAKPKAAYSDLALKTLKRLRKRCRKHAAAEARTGLRSARQLQRRPLKRLLSAPAPVEEASTAPA